MIALNIFFCYTLQMFYSYCIWLVAHKSENETKLNWFFVPNHNTLSVLISEYAKNGKNICKMEKIYAKW